MATYRVKIITAVDRQTAMNKILDLRRAVRDMRIPFSRDVLPYLRREVRRSFQHESDPWGFPWPDWSPRYAATRAAEGSGNTKLRRKWDLFRNLLGGTPRSIANVTMNRLEFGTRDPLATWHQEGRPGRRRGGDLPAREFLGLTDPMVDDIADFILDHLERAVI